ncbi:lamin tail domain-containing protein, partial [Candidatus Woesearchaeota archaeon]|nr:lamin tail domain-containing protein [Candidatus Woesearchaeota archaeon]
LCLAADNILISEVLYDPAGTETGGEAVEIYNPTDSPIDISDYAIKTESSATDAVIPTGTVLGAHTFYLVADAGWSAARDNASWAEADHEEAITMSNSDAGVAIVHPNGTIIDAVGWGDPAGIGAGLFEGTPAAGVAAGNSLKRADIENNGDDNSVDFVESVPDMQNSSTTTGVESNSSESITLEVEVENNAPVVDSVIILGDEDSGTAGVQIIPVPEGIKEFVVSAEVTDLDGAEPAVVATVTGPSGEKNVTMTKVADINSTTMLFNATVQMMFYEDGGLYNVTVIASDAVSNNTASAEFEYLSMAAVSIDASSLQFLGATLGGTAEIFGDFALSTTDSPSVRNIGNTMLDMGLYGTDLVDGVKNIGVNNIKYSFDNDFGSGLSGTLGIAMQTQSLGLANSADSVISLGFQLYVPPETQNGNYTGQVTIVAVSS